MFVKDFLLRAVKSCQFSALAVSLLSINRLLPVLAGLVQSLIIFCPGLFCLVSYSSCPILSASEAIPHNAAGLISLKYSSDGAILRLRQISVTFPPWPIKLREHSLSPVQSSAPPPQLCLPHSLHIHAHGSSAGLSVTVFGFASPRSLPGVFLLIFVYGNSPYPLGSL